MCWTKASPVHLSKTDLSFSTRFGLLCHDVTCSSWSHWHVQVNPTNKWIRKPEGKTSRRTVSVRRNNRKRTAAMDQSVPKHRPRWPNNKLTRTAWRLVTFWVCVLHPESFHRCYDRKSFKASSCSCFHPLSAAAAELRRHRRLFFALNSSMMEYNTPGKYFPSHVTDFPRKSKVALFFFP